MEPGKLKLAHKHFGQENSETKWNESETPLIIKIGRVLMEEYEGIVDLLQVLRTHNINLKHCLISLIDTDEIVYRLPNSFLQSAENLREFNAMIDFIKRRFHSEITAEFQKKLSIFLWLMELKHQMMNVPGVNNYRPMQVQYGLEEIPALIKRPPMYNSAVQTITQTKEMGTDSMLPKLDGMFDKESEATADSNDSPHPTLREPYDVHLYLHKQRKKFNEGYIWRQEPNYFLNEEILKMDRDELVKFLQKYSPFEAEIRDYIERETARAKAAKAAQKPESIQENYASNFKANTKVANELKRKTYG